MSFTESLNQLVKENRNGLLGKHSSWERIALSSVASVLNGFAFPSSEFSKDVGLPLLRIRDILEQDTETNFAGDFDPLYLVKAGDLLIGMDGDFNSALWRGSDALLNQRVCKLTVDGRFYNQKLLAYALPGYLKAINHATSSITVKHLSSRTVEEIPLPLPSRLEQDRIVAEIEKQFTRLDDAVTALRRVQANLKRYQASVLKAACEGRLLPTEAALARKEGRKYEPASDLLKRILAERRAKWEADQIQKMIAVGTPPKNDEWEKKYRAPEPPDTVHLPELPEGWTWASFEQLITFGPQNGLYKPATAYGSGTPIVRIDDYQNDFFKALEELRRLRVDATESSLYSLDTGDILINRVNSPSHLGKCSVIASTIKGAVFESNMMRLRVASCIDSRFLLYYLKSSEGRGRLTKNAKWAVNQASINQQDVCHTPVPIAPLAEQVRIATELDRRLSNVDHLRGQLVLKLSSATQLRSAVLKTAFEGRLVLQSPNDVPASVLLESIRAERANATTRKEKTSKETKTASSTNGQRRRRIKRLAQPARAGKT